MKPNLWRLLAILVLITGFTACKDDENGDKATDPKKMTTHMYLTLRLPSQPGLKAADDNNYNSVGVYARPTVISTVDIYLLSPDGSTLLDSRRLDGANGDFTFQSSGGYSHIYPAKPFKTTPGSKTMVIIINSPEPLLTTPPAADYRYTLSSSLPLSSLARVATEGQSMVIDGVTVYGDVIVISGKSGAFTIEDGVSELDVTTTNKNRVAVDVIRLPSRVIVTSTASPTVTNAAGTVLGSISQVTYSVAQGAKSVYLFPQTNADNTTKTWGYGYFPGPGTNYYRTATTYYDYSDLQNLTDAVPAKPVGSTGAYMYLSGKFLLENTHLSGADLSSSRYRKGNTAYVLIRAKFTPAADRIADGHALAADGTFYVGGVDGKIYSSIAEAQNYETGVGVQDQPVATYTAGKVLYYIWLNPDDILKPVNSPAIRNNVYHVNINSFKSFGENWNPLVPIGPVNPDPKPVGPEPETPIDPTDPLSTTDTYMSVDIVGLPWTVHTYDIDL